MAISQWKGSSMIRSLNVIIYTRRKIVQELIEMCTSKYHMNCTNWSSAVLSNNLSIRILNIYSEREIYA